MYHHILLPTDGSALSENAIRNGVELAHMLKARVTGLFVIRTPRVEDIETYAPDTPGGQPSGDALAAEARGHLSVVEKWARAAGVPCEVAIAWGDSPHQEIIRAAAEHGCDLIVMGSHGRTGPTGELLGSETQQVLLRCKVPVLVYR